MAIGTPVNLGNHAGTSVASNAITTLAAVSAGDLILVFYGTSGALNPTITDTAGNSYAYFNSTSTLCSGVFYCPNALAMSSSSTITVTNGDTPTRSACTAMKISGMATNVNLVSDRGIYQAGSFTVSAVGATTASKQYNALAQTTEVAIECFGSSSSNPGTYTPTSGFTNIGGTGTPCWLIPAYKITSVGTPLALAPSWVNAVTYRAGIFCFRGAVATNTARPDGLLTGFGT